jgi:hypothetical protein
MPLTGVAFMTPLLLPPPPPLLLLLPPLPLLLLLLLLILPPPLLLLLLLPLLLLPLLLLLLLQCLKQYDPELCQHDLRPQCDYGRYSGGAYPPDDCHPFKVGCKCYGAGFVCVCVFEKATPVQRPHLHTPPLTHPLDIGQPVRKAVVLRLLLKSILPLIE